MDTACLPAAVRRFALAALGTLGQRALAERVSAGDEGAAPELETLADLLGQR